MTSSKVFAVWLALGLGLAVIGGLQVLVSQGRWTGFLVTVPLGLLIGLGGGLYRTWDLRRHDRT